MKRRLIALALSLLLAQTSRSAFAESLDAQFEKFILEHDRRPIADSPVYLSFGLPKELERLTHVYANASTGIRLRTFPMINQEVFGAGPLVIREYHILDFEPSSDQETPVEFGRQIRHRSISVLMKPKDDNSKQMNALAVLSTRTDGDSPFEAVDELRLIIHPHFWPKTERGSFSRLAEIALREGRTAKSFLGANVLRGPKEDFPLEPFSIEFSRPILSEEEFNWPAKSDVITSTIFQIDRRYGPSGLLMEVRGSLSRGYRNHSPITYQLDSSESLLIGFTQIRQLAVNLAFEPISSPTTIKGQPLGRHDSPHSCREFIGRLFDAEGPRL